MGRIYYLMGKSAAGKDMVYKRLLERSCLALSPIVIYTTRPPREGERDGNEYHFTDEKGLADMEERGIVIEKRTYQTAAGPWTYFTADDGSIDPSKRDYLGIGTLESFLRLRQYFGADKVTPVYIETDDGIRLERALKRERKQPSPNYEEMCRRFLADQADFSDERLKNAGITRRFRNVEDKEECVSLIEEFIKGER